MNIRNIYQCVGLIAFILLNIQPSSAQDNTLLTIGEQKYSVEEFNYIFNKNNSLSQNPLSRTEYVPLFVNYKLKVLEAIDQGYDTIPSFKRELNYYRNELSKPYLTDKKATEAVLTEAYEHMSYEVDASHILIKLPQSPTPDDTVKAYNKISEIKLLISDEDSFEKVAKEKSEGPSAPKGGRLGYFTGFMMVYPFEKAAFNTTVGEVSDIVRTSFGYHLIFVHDKRENRGEMKVAHIMKAYPQNAPTDVKTKAKTDIDSVYQLLLAGADFTEMIKEHSDDKNTVKNNGELPWFTTGRMVPEFAEAAFALSDSGQISQPIQTPFGWHIIKRIDHRPIASLEDSREDILQKIKRDERAYAGQKATLNRLRKEYKYAIDQEASQQLFNLIIENKSLDADALSELLTQKNISAASFADIELNSGDFGSFLKTKRINPKQLSTQSIAENWDSFADDKIIEYEKEHLEENYPDFKYLMNEYHDGLLIFEISQKEIWNKASEDTLGLEKFFNANKRNYKLEERFEGNLFFCKKKKDLKKVKAQLNNTEMNDSIENIISAYAKIEKGTFSKGQHKLLDQQVWKTEETKTTSEYKYLLTDGELLPAAERELNEVRGQVLSDYQAKLEEDWIKMLREKFKPMVNKTVLDKAAL